MTTPVQIRESLVPFKARILAAVPGTSLNKRTYTKEVLKQCVPYYDGKPFMMDHSLNSEAVIGIFARPRYATERGMDGKMYEGRWLDAVGRMDQDLFIKAKGSGLIPPLVRGFSIGGEGEGDWQGDGGILLKRFVPAEGSLTPFPGIPEAHIAALNIIREHYLKGREIRRDVLEKAKEDPEVYRILKTAGFYQKHPVHEYEVKKKTSNIPVQEKEVSLEEAEKQAAHAQRVYVREAPLPGPDQGAGRDNIPDPIVRKPVLHVQPQNTTSADTGLRVDPMQHSSTSTAFLATGATVSGSGGRRKGNPTEKAPGTASDAGAPGSDDADELPIKTPKAGRTTTQTPGPGKLTPSGTGLADQDEEEEEERRVKVRQDSSDDTDGDGTDDDDTQDEEGEEEEERRKEALRNLGNQTNPKPRNPQKLKTPAAGRTTTQTPGFGKQSPSGTGLRDQDGEEEEEEEESKASIKVKASAKLSIRQDDEPVGVTPGMKSGTESSDDPPEEEEEEDGVTVNPLLKAAQRMNPNPIKSGGEEESQVNPDVIPIQARALSLPVDTAIYQGALRFDRLRNPDRTKEAQGYIDAWAKAKEPKKEKLKRVSVKATESTAGVVTSGTRSLISTIQPTISAREDQTSIQTRAQTNESPTRPLMQAQSSVNTLSETASDIISKMSKEPFGYWNQAGRAYRKLLPQILDVR